MRLLVVNVGSSTLKVSVIEDGEIQAAVAVPLVKGSFDEGVLAKLIARHGPFDAVGHRVVHGGDRFAHAVLVDEQVRRDLGTLVDLAPLHLPASLEAMDAVCRLLPNVQAVACFDTAFHATLPPEAATYALPEAWRRRWGLRRYGFHGLSHAWCATRLAELAGGHLSTLRLVTCHLGAGASLAAVRGGISIDTTMGFSPLEGLVMETRSGSVDPGLVLWLEEHVGLSSKELAFSLEHRSGLLGLTGHGDVRAVLEAEASGDERARLGMAVYLHRLRAGIAQMAAAMGGIDAVCFTGGVGEHAPSVRARALEGLGFLGLALERAANDAAAGDALISPAASTVAAWVIEAHEDLQIAREVAALLA
jgi:acetate kinase